MSDNCGDCFLCRAEEAIHEVDWDAGGKVHNWRNHVPEIVRMLWDDLSDLGKVSVYLMASQQSDAEEWE